MALRKSIFVIVFLASFGWQATTLSAAPASDATAFVNSLVKDALAALANKQQSNDARAQSFRTLLDQNFDLPRISRFVLGRYWEGASEQERKDFSRLFEEYVVRSYAVSFGQYNGETVKVTGSRPEGETGTIVSSQIDLPNGAPPAKVDWRVRHEGNDYRIVDVNVEGVSMVLTQREQFAAVIQRGGGTVASLNQSLQQKLASGDTGNVLPGLQGSSTPKK
ncbi:MAG TPA: ABC transporter substrate-binding protein [Stellaceae bacterium]|nr:ABC transporter substrate-binding protein [Stellaceae bacterium]